jgi:hypothetical protein
LHIYEEVQSFSLLKEQKFVYHDYTKEEKLQLIKKLLQQG